MNFFRSQRPPPEALRKAGRLIWPTVKRYRGRLLVGFGALLAVDFLQLFIPRLIKRAVDGLEAGTITQPVLLRYGGMIVLLALVIAFCRFGWRYLLLGFSRLQERDLRNQLFSHLLTLDRPFFHRRPPGEIMALATNDLAAVQLAAGMGLVALVDAVVMSVAALAFMAYIHPVLTLIAVSPMPVLAVLTGVLSRRLHHRFKRVQEQFSTLTQFVRTTFSSIRLLKAYTQEEPQTRRFDGLGRAYIRNNLRLARVHGTLFPLSGFIANLSLLLILYFGGRLTMRGVITTGDFVAFISYLLMLTWPMMALGWVTNLFQRGLTSLDRVQTVLEEEPLLHDPAAGASSRPSLAGRYQVRDLTFSYLADRQPALCDFSVSIETGLTGVVGRTGSGKTTLCQLLARLYPVPDATIFLDGTDINRLPLAAVRRQIAYVPQEVTLFAETIAFNLSLGRPEASREEMIRAAGAAALHEEIMAMEHGYDTRLGERGVTLSGGQRQRLALARALLLERPILIIDDGLSAVDMETEQMIIRSLAGHIRGRTCLIVSHRVAPLAAASTILVLEQGRLVGQGPHERLMLENEFYRRIYDYQMNATGAAAP